VDELSAATETQAGERAGAGDPVLFSVLANRMESICREMSNTLLRTARSSVLALAHDFSCSIVSANDELLASADGLPVHVIGAASSAEAMTRLQPEIAPGDAFLHNDQYEGNTHAGDFTIIVPVFHEGTHVFTTVVRGHQADVGNSLPTTYMMDTPDVYAEGALVFPCVRVQRDYEDVPDIIRMCFARIRSPDIWYGDHLAMVGAARVGERSLKQVVEKHGIDTIRSFVDFWLDYGERRMTRAISQLRSGTCLAHTAHDPVAGLDEIPLQIRVSVDAEEGRVEVDLRDNPDCIPAGLNQSETTARSNVFIGLFNCLDPSVPKNSGSFRRVNVLLRENCVVGIPRFPACCSVSTTNIADRIVNMTQSAITQLGEGYGVAEGPVGLGPDRPNCAGKDRRHGERDYAVQLFIGTQGGPAAPEADGWLAFVLPVAAGVLHKNSVEATEHKLPIVIHENRIRVDGEGPGKTRGAPGNALLYGPLHDRMDVYYVPDGVRNPPRGVLGGDDAVGPGVLVRRTDGEYVDMTDDVAGHIALEPGECLRALSCGGAGYGPAFERDPELVLVDVREGYVTVARAAERYGVAIAGDEALPETLTVDAAATAELRRARASAEPAPGA
jgi:N-methylhydantoinase B